MRRVLSFIGLALPLIGCSSENVAAPPPAPVDWHAFDVPHGPVAAAAGPTARERAVAEAYAAAVSAQGFGDLAARLAPDAHFTFPGVPDGRGREAVLRGHEVLFAAFDKRALAVSRLWRTDAETTIEWTLTGVQSQPWMGVPASGKPVSFKGITLLFTKDDGTIADVHVTFDVAVVKAQLGAGPKELASLPPAPSPSGTPNVVEQGHTPEEAHAVQVGRAWIDALEKGDEAGYLGAMTDDAAIDTLERPQPIRGKEELKAHFRAMHRAIGQLDTTLDNAWGVGNYAIVEYFVAGEQLAAIGWVPAQREKVIRLHVVDVMEMQGGKIAHVWRFDNLAQMASPAM